jgi:hypothetical protein
MDVLMEEGASTVVEDTEMMIAGLQDHLRGAQ